MHERDCHAALADGCRNALDRAQPHVAAGEHAGHACLEQIGSRPCDQRPARFRSSPVSTKPRPSRAMSFRQPFRLRIGADEDEQAAALVPAHLLGLAVADVDRGEMLVAMHRLDFRPQLQPQCWTWRGAARSGSATCSCRAIRPAPPASLCARGWQRTAPLGPPSCRRRRDRHRVHACRPPRCARRRSRRPCRSAGRSLRWQGGARMTPVARMRVLARTTSLPSSQTSRAAGSRRATERVTRISAPSRFACCSARLPSSSPDTPLGNPR